MINIRCDESVLNMHVKGGPDVVAAELSKVIAITYRCMGKRGKVEAETFKTLMEKAMESGFHWTDENDVDLYTLFNQMFLEEEGGNES